jgi:hypothetical protein
MAVSLLVAFAGFFAIVFSGTYLQSVIVVCISLVQFGQIVVIPDYSYLISMPPFGRIAISLLVAFAGFFTVVFSGACLLSVVIVCSSSVRFAQIVVVTAHSYPISLPPFGKIDISLLVTFAGFFAVVFSGTCLLSVIVVCSSSVQFAQIVLIPAYSYPVSLPPFGRIAVSLLIAFAGFFGVVFSGD